MVTTVDAFDSKLADYVFFPLSYVFGQTSKLPRKAIEFSLQCLQEIIVRGWGTCMDGDLCKQLLKLLATLLNRESEGQADQDVLCYILDCLGGLLRSIEQSTLTVAEDRDELVPILGQLLLTTLTIVVESSILKTQLAASKVVAAMMAYIQDQDTLRKFLPGVVSQLTKVIQPRTNVRRPYRVLVNCLEAMSSILRKALGDKHDTEVAPETLRPSQKSSQWEIATSAQVKLALANIVKVRGHERQEVVDALLSLCVDVIKVCSTSLRSSVEMMLETVIFLFSNTTAGENKVQKSILLDYLSMNNAQADCLAGLVHKWLTSLPTAMLSSNAEEQKRLCAQISTAYRFLTEADGDTSSLDTPLMTSLSESVSSLMQRPKPGQGPGIEPVAGENSQAIQTTVKFEASSEFKPLVPGGSNNGASLLFLQQMMESVIRGTSFHGPSQQLAEELVSASGKRLTVALWLSSRLLEAQIAETSGMREFVNLSDEDAISELLDLAFSCAVRTLSAEPTQRDIDWEQEAIALEVVALQARYLGQDFRPELVDVLFPIVERIGSTSRQLREHAMVCLNIVSHMSGYSDPGAMIVQNVDYMVNAVALKFNTFTISPQAPQVLVMMLHLSGPSLLPYLDDLLDSIFAALASFHGYPLIVESLFRVLRAIIDQGRLDSSGRIEDVPSHNLTFHKHPKNITDVKDILKKIRSLSSGLAEAKDDEDTTRTIPEIEDASIAQEDDQMTTDTESANNPSKSYKMIQSIIRLGQYYLTHESPLTRQQLLQIVGTGCVSLSGNEDEFLPLVNDVWPMVIRRLYDNEPNVMLAATSALSVLFQHSGDFVSTRVESEWPEIRSLYQRTTVAMESEKKWKGGRLDHTPAHRRWSGLTAMMIDLMNFVRITPVMEDDLVEMLGPFATSRHDIREALERVNADAIWLYLKSREDWSKTPPVLDGFSFNPVSF